MGQTNQPPKEHAIDVQVEYQTRNDAGELRYWPTFSAAMRHAEVEDRTVWKVSFTIDAEERIRLVRDEVGRWIYEPIVLVPTADEGKSHG